MRSVYFECWASIAQDGPKTSAITSGISGPDQTPIQVTDASDSSTGDQLLIAGGLVLVFGGPEDPVGDIAAAGYLGYEWLIIDTAVVAAGSSGGLAQTSYPPVPWADPSQSPGAG
jgi:hypothetical protein